MTTERFAYPLLPAFRHGAQTPWGGDALARLFHKAIPDARTGEAMEASTWRAWKAAWRTAGRCPR